MVSCLASVQPVPIYLLCRRCWISGNYQKERIFLECFFVGGVFDLAGRGLNLVLFMQELLTIAISFVLYTLILLRVRGSTVISKNNIFGHGLGTQISISQVLG